MMTTTQEAPKSRTPDEDMLDVLIVGGGFSGIYQLDRLRDEGFDVKVWDAAGDFGGIWWWNCYPGAHTDTTAHCYQFNYKDLWKDYDFDKLYSNWEAVRKYLNHVGDRLDLRKDFSFNTFADKAQWDETSRTWTVTSTDGKRARAHTLIVATGFGSKRSTRPSLAWTRSAARSTIRRAGPRAGWTWPARR